MAIHCMNCGTELPDEAAFCWKCGRPQKEGAGQAPTATAAPKVAPRWEYKDITVEFPKEGFTKLDPSNHGVLEELGMRADEIILKRLKQEGEEGWQAEGTTSFRTLLGQHRILTSRHNSFWRGTVFSYLSVPLRLRRQI